MRELYVPLSGGEHILGWIAPHTIITSSWNAECGDKTVRAVDVETGAMRILWDGNFDAAALDPATGTILLGVEQVMEWCGSGRDSGLFLISPHGDPRRIGEPLVILRGGQGIEWIPGGNVFVVRSLTGGPQTWESNPLMAVTLEGEIAALPGPPGARLAAPPTDGPWAWYNEASADRADWGLWIGPRDVEPQQISSENVLHAAWTPGGERVFFMTSTPGLRDFGGAVYVASAPDFTPVLLGRGLEFTWPVELAWVP